ncbi:hypothetical protein KGY71_06445, partial [Candidatus Bipolaricaulota bacterium]|nr:hypothetical protein [Candidatus Bipolaricaulota bacterium]
MRRSINLTLTITILFLALGVSMEPVPGNAQTVETSADLAGAVQALKRGNYGTAEEVLSDYPENGPLGSYSRYLLARAYLGLSNLNAALDLLEEVEAGGQSEVLEFERYYLEAEILHELGRNERAGEVAGNASDFVETAREEKKLLEL